MAQRKITELVRATSVSDNDLLVVETNNGTRSVPYSKFVKPLPFANNAAAHNGIFRGKDLTNIYTIDQICSKISNGTFEDLYIGDYFDVTINTSYESNETIRCIFAQFENANSSFTDINNNRRNYAIIITKNVLKKYSKMYENTTDMITGGYAGSIIFTDILPTYSTSLQTVFNNHIITYKAHTSTAINSSKISMFNNDLEGRPTGFNAKSVTIDLLSEMQVFGYHEYVSYPLQSSFNSQFSIFRLDSSSKGCTRKTTAPDGNNYEYMSSYWLRDIASKDSFCSVFENPPIPNYSSCSAINYIRPYFLIG